MHLLHAVCSGNLSHDIHKLVTLKTYHHFQASIKSRLSFICFPAALNLLLSWFYQQLCGAPRIFCLVLAVVHLCFGCWACTGYPLGQSAHSSWSNTVPDLKCLHMKKTMSNCSSGALWHTHTGKKGARRPNQISQLSALQNSKQLDWVHNLCKELILYSKQCLHRDF